MAFLTSILCCCTSKKESSTDSSAVFTSKFKNAAVSSKNFPAAELDTIIEEADEKIAEEEKGSTLNVKLSTSKSGDKENKCEKDLENEKRESGEEELRVREDEKEEEDEIQKANWSMIKKVFVFLGMANNPKGEEITTKSSKPKQQQQPVKIKRWRKVGRILTFSKVDKTKDENEEEEEENDEGDTKSAKSNISLDKWKRVNKSVGKVGLMKRLFKPKAIKKWIKANKSIGTWSRVTGNKGLFSKIYSATGIKKWRKVNKKIGTTSKMFVFFPKRTKNKWKNTNKKVGKVGLLGRLFGFGKQKKSKWAIVRKSFGGVSRFRRFTFERKRHKVFRKWFKSQLLLTAFKNTVNPDDAEEHASSLDTSSRRQSILNENDRQKVENGNSSLDKSRKSVNFEKIELGGGGGGGGPRKSISSSLLAEKTNEKPLGAKKTLLANGEKNINEIQEKVSPSVVLGRRLSRRLSQIEKNLTDLGNDETESEIVQMKIRERKQSLSSSTDPLVQFLSSGQSIGATFRVAKAIARMRPKKLEIIEEDEILEDFDENTQEDNLQKIASSTIRRQSITRTLSRSNSKSNGIEGGGEGGLSSSRPVSSSRSRRGSFTGINNKDDESLASVMDVLAQLEDDENEEGKNEKILSGNVSRRESKQIRPPSTKDKPSFGSRRGSSNINSKENNAEIRAFTTTIGQIASRKQSIRGFQRKNSNLKKNSITNPEEIDLNSVASALTRLSSKRTSMIGTRFGSRKQSEVGGGGRENETLTKALAKLASRKQSMIQAGKQIPGENDGLSLALEMVKAVTGMKKSGSLIKSKRGSTDENFLTKEEIQALTDAVADEVANFEGDLINSDNEEDEDEEIGRVKSRAGSRKMSLGGSDKIKKNGIESPFKRGEVGENREERTKEDFVEKGENRESYREWSKRKMRIENKEKAEEVGELKDEIKYFLSVLREAEGVKQETRSEWAKIKPVYVTAWKKTEIPFQNIIDLIKAVRFNPPKSIQMLFECLCILRGIQPEIYKNGLRKDVLTVNYKKVFQKLLATDFPEKLLDIRYSDPISLVNIAELQVKFLSNPEFNRENMLKAFPPSAFFYDFIVNIEEFSRINFIVEEIKKRRSLAIQLKKDSREEIRKLQNKIMSIEKRFGVEVVD